MTEKLSEYEMDHRLPDKELDAFYDKMKQDVMSLCTGWKQRLSKLNIVSVASKIKRRKLIVKLLPGL